MSTAHSSNPQAPQILERAKVYHSIKSRLQRQLGRRWPGGTRLPPIKELAKQLKTGQTNTHRAVKELARAGLLVSRSGQGTFVTERAGAGTAVASGTAGAGTDGTDAAVAHVIIRPPAGSLTGMTVKVLTAMAEPDQFIRRSMDAFGNILRGDGAAVVHSVYAYQQSPDA